MSRSIRLGFLVVAIASLFVLAACGGENAGGNTGGNAGENGNGGAAGDVRAVTVGAVGSELKFTEEKITVKSGETVKVVFNNDSALPHSFAMDNPKVSIPDNVVTGLATGQSGEATFVAPAPGTYTYYCAVPGHREAGMVGVLEVTP
ncbi:MAG: hypothetical protein KatS3mg057_2641 [Herpetosiphonaceae bacterium]|nr:MAG: hypothetical protein KatS3mg057_2641 [Herpetosiphonaceae bacterium]